MKLLTVAIPCYNSQDYMEKCIRSALVGGDEVEILVVNDGSSDKTEEIGRKYEKKYPGIVRLINQENKGHGGAVNTGIENATGVFFKVVDSDDYLATKPLKAILDTLRKYSDGSLDAMFSNFVYDKVGAKRKKVMHYRGLFPQDRLFTWEEAGNFPAGKYILMHSVIYRTQLLRDSGMKLPEHTFYVDNLFVFEPLPKIKTMYYMDVVLYRYFIGREDQSVNEKVMMGRIDQQIRVNKCMIDYTRDNDIFAMNKKLSRYMLSYTEIITGISSVLLIKIGTKEALEQKQELWDYIKVQNPELHRVLKKRFLGFNVNLNSRAGRRIVKIGYDIAQSIFHFN